MAPPFHVYWYETDNGPPPAELAPLALAVDGIVIPTRKLDATFFVDPTTIASPIASKTIRSPGYGDISDWVIAGQPVPKSFASLREVALRHAAQDQQCVGDAHAESVMQDFSSWCFAQYGLEFFMEHASFNNGLLIGKQPLPALDLFSRADGLQRAQAALNQWLLVLSVSSVSIALPSVHVQSIEQIEELRRRSSDERAEYLTYLRELLYDGRTYLLSNPSLADLEKWAYFVAQSKILPSVEKLERSVEHLLAKKLTERIGTALLEKSSTFTTSLGKTGATTSVLTEVALELLATVAPRIFNTLVERRETQKTPGLGYLYRLRQQMQ